MWWSARPLTPRFRWPVGPRRRARRGRLARAPECTGGRSGASSETRMSAGTDDLERREGFGACQHQRRETDGDSDDMKQPTQRRPKARSQALVSASRQRPRSDVEDAGTRREAITTAAARNRRKTLVSNTGWLPIVMSDGVKRKPRNEHMSAGLPAARLGLRSGAHLVGSDSRLLEAGRATRGDHRQPDRRSGRIHSACVRAELVTIDASIGELGFD